jgi:hypothetical protein
MLRDAYPSTGHEDPPPLSSLSCNLQRACRMEFAFGCYQEGILMAKTARKTTRKYSRGASRKVEKAMHERKHGTLRSGSTGKKVKSRKQAIAIGLSEARREGKKVPARRTARSKAGRKATRRTTSRSKKK